MDSASAKEPPSIGKLMYDSLQTEIEDTSC